MNKSQLHGKLGQSGKGLRGALAGMLGAMLLCIPVPALACTLYAAQGTAVADGGTIAAKNRDWRPQEQSLHLAEPRQPGGYRYYGLYGGPFERHQLRGGVNEAGLVAYSAAVSSVTKKQKAAEENRRQGADAAASAASVQQSLDDAQSMLDDVQQKLDDVQSMKNEAGRVKDKAASAYAENKDTIDTVLSYAKEGAAMLGNLLLP